jgi:MFS family permease
MSLGSAAFASGSWALLADLVPKDRSAQFFGLANLSTAGSAAFAGLFGPIIDGAERISPGAGYSVLFVLASFSFLLSALPLKGFILKKHGEIHEDKSKVRPHAPGLAVVPLPADPALLEEDDQDSQGGNARL